MPVTINGTAGVTFNDSSVQGASAIGYSQTWQNVTGSRSTGVTYTNTTGKPIMVVVATNYSGSTATLTVDGIQANIFGCTAAGTSNCTAIVPAGSTYSYSSPNGISTWTELR